MVHSARNMLSKKSLSISSLRKARKESEESDKTDHVEAQRAWEELQSGGPGVVTGSYRERVEKSQHGGVELMGIGKNYAAQVSTI